uniref:Uncharacterized protein n=1 Tax=Anguilla anguilla TaxID=7936 RepID=A0A0E9T588_ANGAN
MLFKCSDYNNKALHFKK